MIRALLLSTLVFAPSAALACGMPMSAVRSVRLAEALEEVDAAKPAPPPVEVVEAPAPVPAPAPAPAPAPVPTPTT